MKKMTKKESVYNHLIRRDLATTGGVNLRENTSSIDRFDDGKHSPSYPVFVPDKKAAKRGGRNSLLGMAAGGHFVDQRQSAERTILESARRSMMKLSTRARTTYQSGKDSRLED